MLKNNCIPGSRGSRGSGPWTAARHLPNTRRGSGWRELKTNSLKLIPLIQDLVPAEGAGGEDQWIHRYWERAGEVRRREQSQTLLASICLHCMGDPRLAIWLSCLNWHLGASLPPEPRRVEKFGSRDYLGALLLPGPKGAQNKHMYIITPLTPIGRPKYEDLILKYIELHTMRSIP